MQDLQKLKKQLEAIDLHPNGDGEGEKVEAQIDKLTRRLKDSRKSAAESREALAKALADGAAPSAGEVGQHRQRAQRLEAQCQDTEAALSVLEQRRAEAEAADREARAQAPQRGRIASALPLRGWDKRVAFTRPMKSYTSRQRSVGKPWSSVSTASSVSWLICIHLLAALRRSLLLANGLL